MRVLFHCCCEPDATEETDSTKTRVYSSPVRSTVVGALCEYVFHCCCEPDATEERQIPLKLGSTARLYILQS